MASLRRLIAAMFVVLTMAVPAQAACPDGASCGRVAVPLDRSGQTPGTLSIAYAKLAAKGTRQGTLVFLSGGPGQAAIPLTRSFSELVAPLLDTYDFVAVDQRGTGGSSATRCSLETRQDVADCAARLGPQRAFLTTRETADDLENLRQALDADKLTLFGVSYGTAVAQEYARRFPEHTAAVILDSPAPVDGLDGVDQLRTFGTPRVLREVCYPGDCHETIPDPDTALERAIKRLPLKGTAVGATGKTHRASATEALLYGAIAASDLSPVLRGMLPAAIASAAKGDAAPLLHLAAIYGNSDDSSSGVSVARLLATGCIESLLPWAPDSPVASRTDAVKAFVQQRTEAFAPFSPSVVLGSSLTNFCATWPPTPKPPAPPAPAATTPVLILSGREDLRTPLESARRTLAQYPGGQLLAVPGVGHSVLGTDASGCARKGVIAFLRGRPIAKCRRSRAGGAAAYIPATLGKLRPYRLPGQPGRVVSAALATITGVSYDVISTATRDTPGLRGGYVHRKGTKVELHGVEWVKGVRVSGTLELIGPAGDLTIDGPLDGTLSYTKKGFEGEVGGKPFRL